MHLHIPIPKHSLGLTGVKRVPGWIVFFTALVPSTGSSQAFSTRPARVVAPLPTSGSFDVTARVPGQRVAVENRPSEAAPLPSNGSGLIAASAARAANINRELPA